jgi:hypothetical protein
MQGHLTEIDIEVTEAKADTLYHLDYGTVIFSETVNATAIEELEDMVTPALEGSAPLGKRGIFRNFRHIYEVFEPLTGHSCRLGGTEAPKLFLHLMELLGEGIKLLVPGETLLLTAIEFLLGDG